MKNPKSVKSSQKATNSSTKNDKTHLAIALKAYQRGDYLELRGIDGVEASNDLAVAEISTIKGISEPAEAICEIAKMVAGDRIRVHALMSRGKIRLIFVLGDDDQMSLLPADRCADVLDAIAQTFCINNGTDDKPHRLPKHLSARENDADFLRRLSSKANKLGTLLPDAAQLFRPLESGDLVEIEKPMPLDPKLGKVLKSESRALRATIVATLPELGWVALNNQVIITGIKPKMLRTFKVGDLIDCSGKPGPTIKTVSVEALELVSKSLIAAK